MMHNGEVAVFNSSACFFEIPISKTFKKSRKRYLHCAIGTTSLGGSQTSLADRQTSL
ncbi:MAG: hypothetical protein IJY91_00285 [Oscillospiraceae bacterium]|nr:hypothetical protein [Oscillospiraceae bacterium]